MAVETAIWAFGVILASMRPIATPFRTIILVVLCVLIHLYSRQEQLVETGYSSRFYPVFASFLRRINGFLPISLGDLLYGVFFAWLLLAIVRKWRNRRKPGNQPPLTGFWWRQVNRICLIYIVFNLFWGINYNRSGIASQLGLEVRDYTLEELKDLNCLLVDSIRSSKTAALALNRPIGSNREVFEMVRNAYREAALKNPLLHYGPSSIKSSMWGWLGNYTGFTGYYNPFTGEAQVNTTVPRFLQPFIGCHEVAHQLGYARENEANFVGYLAAREASDPRTRYSAYLDVFTYANRSLYALDSSSAKLYRKELPPSVMADIDEWIAFNRRHQGPIEPLVRWAYGKYLENNRQPKGIFSYDEVTAYLIALRRKTGTI